MSASTLQNLLDAMSRVESLEAGIEYGLDTLRVIGNEYFSDGTEEAYKNQQIMSGKDNFERTNAALLFTEMAMRKIVDSLRDAADEIYSIARKAVEAQEQE